MPWSARSSLAESRHALRTFDSLFGLTAIALSDEAAFDSVLTGITLQASAVRPRWKAPVAPLTEAPAALSWQPGSPDGLAAFEAFRADPTLVGGGLSNGSQPPIPALTVIA
jgi:hypothetical protein